MKFGILDTKDELWIGDRSGPRLFDDWEIAQVAAQIAETQVFGTDLGARYKAYPFDPKQPARLRDDVPVKYDSAAALKRMGVD
jgi:hypothetical protein